MQLGKKRTITITLKKTKRPGYPIDADLTPRAGVRLLLDENLVLDQSLSPPDKSISCFLIKFPCTLDCTLQVVIQYE